MGFMTGARPGASESAAQTTQQNGLRGAVRWLRGRAEPAAGQPAAGQPAAGQSAADGAGADDGLDSGTAPAAETPGAQTRQGGVPRLLQDLAAWSWRLLLVAVVIYLSFRVAEALRLVVLPFIAAMLLTALLQPATAWMKRRGMPPLLATWCTFLAAILVIAGAITLFANRVSADYPALSAEVQRTADQVQRSLAGAPFHLNRHSLQQYTNDLVKYLSQHKAEVAGTVLTGGKYAVEVLTGLVLTLFIAFFLLKDGARIWTWLISGLHRPEAHRRAVDAGDSAWRALVNYMRGTLAVAAIHALFLGLAIWLLGLPLLVPLIVLVFLAAFVPIIGILVVGALACLIALATKGWVAAVILLAVLILENQIESHLLQPLVVGRIIRLHPLAIILVLAVGAIIAGIPGAIVAVPVAAVITYAWPALRPRRPGG
jgi:predicted PurR-regulated permease PerM